MSVKDKDILFLCQFFYPEYVSSATLPFDTAKFLVEGGYKVGALCGYPKEYNDSKTDIPKRETVCGIDITRVKYVQLDRKKVIGRIINYFSFVAAAIFAISKAKHYKTVIVYSNPPLLPLVAMMCKKFYGCKIVFVSYDVYPELAIKTGTISSDGIMAKCFRFINKHFLKKVDKVVALSEDMKKFLVENRDITEENVVVIPNWYEDKANETVEKTDILNMIDDEEFVISYLGNLGTCQDEKSILELAKSIPSDARVCFLVAGHGNKMEFLKDSVEKEGISNIIILPFLHGQDYETVLKRSNMFMATLVKGTQGLCAPSKIYAYLMSGKPVLLSVDNEMEIAQDIIINNAGILMENVPIVQIVKEILSLKDNEELLVQMGGNARKLFLKKYEMSTCLFIYKKMFEDILKESK